MEPQSSASSSAVVSAPGDATGATAAPPTGSIQAVNDELLLAMQHYERAVAELEAAARAGDGTLDPSVATTMRTSLTSIDQAIAESRAALQDSWLYPDGSGHRLKQKLAASLGVDPAQITLGNGSNDVLVLIAEAFLRPGLEAIYSQYAFAVYPIAVQATGATAVVSNLKFPKV